MGGTFTLDDQGIVLSQPATPAAVFKFDSSALDDESRYRLVPNVVCDLIERGVGAQASTARFHYLIDNTGVYSDWPDQFDSIWPQTARSTQYVVVPDDRIAVIAWTPSGERRMLFDGFAAIPQVNIDGGRQHVSFVAVGCEIRCWDVPISGRVQRDADDPITGNQVQTDLPVRFNPSDGKGGVLPNCTPQDHDHNQGDDTISYPVFIEECIERDTKSNTLWTIPKACRYLLSVHNDGKYVNNPLMYILEDLLVVKVPSALDGNGVVDPSDPNTYDEVPAPLRDYDASNKPWPEALEELLAQVGYGFYFDTPHDPGGDNPTTDLYLFRFDEDTITPKTILLDDYGSILDPGRNDGAQLSLARDINQVVNAFTIETPQRQWEVSIILAPGFTPAAGDEAAASRGQFLKSKSGDATSTVARKYRWYVGDECGDGHWDGSSFVTGAGLDLSPLFPDNDDETASYVRRYRKGSNKLITLDQQQQPRKALLHYSQTYTGAYPAVWDGTGVINTDWKPIAAGWALLGHRLGIHVTVEDPESWAAGNNEEVIKGITWQANPPAGKRFFLLLTTVIDDDIMLESVVPARVASPTRFQRRRRVDARDHYKFQGVATPSVFNQGTDDVVVRDDTEKALALGRQYRAAHEMPPLCGSVTIPYITNYYSLSDQISTIEGRSVSLKANAAGDKGEGDRYPFVVKLVWSFQGDHQSTTLHLTDLRAEVRG